MKKDEKKNYTNMAENTDIENAWLHYRSGLRSFLRSRVANEADVDDILQITLIKTYQSLSMLRDESKIQSWMYQIAKRSLIDFYRMQKSDSTVLLEDMKADNQDECDAQTLLVECIKPFLSLLSKDSQELLTAIYLNGMSQKKLAEQNSIPYSTLKSKVQKSRDELRSLFEDCCTMEFDRQGKIIDFEKNPNRKVDC